MEETDGTTRIVGTIRKSKRMFVWWAVNVTVCIVYRIPPPPPTAVRFVGIERAGAAVCRPLKNTRGKLAC